jgi:hypothetical protein
MNKTKEKQELVGPWRNLHGAIWLLGLAILAWQNWWWPGILVLAGLSLALEGVLKQYAPQAFETIEPPSSPSPADKSPLPSSPAPSASQHRLDLLPSVCPKCGGPIRGHEVQWTGPQSADCPYCGASLPMVKS